MKARAEAAKAKEAEERKRAEAAKAKEAEERKRAEAKKAKEAEEKERAAAKKAKEAEEKERAKAAKAKETARSLKRVEAWPAKEKAKEAAAPHDLQARGSVPEAGLPGAAEEGIDPARLGKIREPARIREHDPAKAFERALRQSRTRRARESDRVADGEQEPETAPATGRGSDRPRSPSPRSAAAIFEEGYALLRGGDHRGAAAKWEEAVALDPDSRTYQTNLKMLQRLLESPEEGAPLISSATRDIPLPSPAEEEPATPASASAPPADSGEAWDQAVSRLSRGVRQEHLAAEHFERGLELMREGALDKARREWEAALEMEPENRSYRTNLKMLRRRIEKGEG